MRSSIGPPNLLVARARASLRPGIAGQVGICKLFDHNGLHRVSHPGDYFARRCRSHVANEPIQIKVILFGPFGDTAGRMADGSLDVVSSHSCPV